MLDLREVATILAALVFWKEEIAAHGNETAAPYLKAARMEGVEPLTVPEIVRLSARLRRTFGS